MHTSSLLPLDANTLALLPFLASAGNAAVAQSCVTSLDLEGKACPPSHTRYVDGGISLICCPDTGVVLEDLENFFQDIAAELPRNAVVAVNPEVPRLEVIAATSINTPGATLQNIDVDLDGTTSADNVVSIAQNGDVNTGGNIESHTPDAGIAIPAGTGVDPANGNLVDIEQTGVIDVNTGESSASITPAETVDLTGQAANPFLGPVTKPMEEGNTGNQLSSIGGVDISTLTFVIPRAAVGNEGLHVLPEERITSFNPSGAFYVQAPSDEKDFFHVLVSPVLKIALINLDDNPIVVRIGDIPCTVVGLRRSEPPNYPDYFGSADTLIDCSMESPENDRTPEETTLALYKAATDTVTVQFHHQGISIRDGVFSDQVNLVRQCDTNSVRAKLWEIPAVEGAVEETQPQPPVLHCMQWFYPDRDSCTPLQDIDASSVDPALVLIEFKDVNGQPDFRLFGCVLWQYSPLDGEDCHTDDRFTYKQYEPGATVNGQVIEGRICKAL